MDVLRRIPIANIVLLMLMCGRGAKMAQFEDILILGNMFIAGEVDK